MASWEPPRGQPAQVAVAVGGRDRLPGSGVGAVGGWAQFSFRCQPFFSCGIRWTGCLSPRFCSRSGCPRPAVLVLVPGGALCLSVGELPHWSPRGVPNVPWLVLKVKGALCPGLVCLAPSPLASKSGPLSGPCRLSGGGAHVAAAGTRLRPAVPAPDSPPPGSSSVS